MLSRFIVVLLSIGFSTNIAAQNRETISQFSALKKWQSNLRTTLDLSSAGVFNDQDSFTKNIVGLDLHKVISGKNHDIATIIFQPYIVNFSGRDRQPFFFDDRDTELTWRITNVNFKVGDGGAFNIRVGHFEIPFGLEQNIDTNGTLRQYSSFDRGIKLDWGVSANGVTPKWDYEFAISRGSGNDISDRDQPFIVSGRIGTPAHKNRVIGLSFFTGEVLGEVGTTRQQRIGVDFAWYYNQWEFLSELSAGEINNADTALALLETSWRNPRESSHIYVQLKHRHDELELRREQGVSLIAGINQALSRSFSISSQWSTSVDKVDSKDDSSSFKIQLRYRL